MYKSEIPTSSIYFKLLVFPIFWLISKLPIILLKGLSNVIYLILYYIVRYRKKIVRKNLSSSFPNWSETKIIKVEKAFYRYLSDLIFEIIKGISITGDQVEKRIPNKSIPLYDKLFNQNKSIIVALSHSGNWEWVSLMSQRTVKFQVYITYKPLANKNFNSLMFNTRSKFGAIPVSMSETLRQLNANKNWDTPTLTALVADQNPASPKGAQWEYFLNQDTAFLNGPGKLSKRFGMPVVYIKCKRIERFKYETESKILVSDASAYSPDEINRLIISEMENDILEQPETWLWSHRRWKHSR